MKRLPIKHFALHIRAEDPNFDEPEIVGESEENKEKTRKGKAKMIEILRDMHQDANRKTREADEAKR